MYRLSHYPTLYKSKGGHKRGQFLMGFDNFGVVEKLRFSAFQSPLSLVRGTLLNYAMSDSAAIYALYISELLFLMLIPFLNDLIASL